MANEIQTVISHVSVGTNDFEKARKFNEHLLSPLGCRVLVEHAGAVGFGKVYPEFWLGTPFDGGRASPGNGCHVSFVAQSKVEVDAFFKTALAAGATEDGNPGHRHDYGSNPTTAASCAILMATRLNQRIGISNWRQSLE